MKILLVEDDETLTQVLTKNLEEHHYVVDAVTDGETGWTYGSTFDYDLIVLDVMLPKLSGIQLCQRFRAESYATPILLLTAQDTSAAKIQGLDAGADDYVVKPCDIPELVARIRALLRRGSTSASPLLSWENLLLNPSTCEVTYEGQPLTLTAKEYELLELFLRDSQHVFSVEEILDGLWSSEEFPAEATVRSHIRRLRHKLAAAGVPDLIATVHGRGYYLRSVASEVQSQLPAESSAELQAVTNQTAEYPESSSVSNQPAQNAPLEPEWFNAQPLFSRSIEQQIQYGEFLARTWTTTQLKSLEQVQVILAAGQAAYPRTLSDHQRQQAIHAAHKLAGTLGMFGLEVGMQCARQIEQLFCQDPLPTSLINLLGEALRQEIEQTPSIKPHWQGFGLAPLVLVLDDDPSFTQPLVKLAADFGLRTAIAPTVAAARTWMSAEISPNPYPRNLVLSRLPEPDAVDRAERLTWLEALMEHSRWSSLLIGDRQNLPAFLTADLPPSCRFLEQPVSPSHLLTAMAELLNPQPDDYKVMVVDDDLDWLAVLPVLLHPWNFQLTTLAEPQHFWAILESAMPDLLVLDVRMPQVSGLELCQALRSHVRWARLPVLFLTSLNTPQDQTQAFALGADDYLCKPVTGIDLATRICNRLRRVQAWAS